MEKIVIVSDLSGQEIVGKYYRVTIKLVAKKNGEIINDDKVIEKGTVDLNGFCQIDMTELEAEALFELLNNAKKRRRRKKTTSTDPFKGL